MEPRFGMKMQLIACAACATLMALSAPVAFGAPEWLVEAKAVPAAKPVKVVAHTTIAQRMSFEDTKEGVKIECEVSSSGIVWESSDLTEAFSTQTCKTVAGNCLTPTIVAAHLPWDTTLSEPKAGEVIDTFTNSGAGEPGLRISCFGIFLEECLGAVSSSMENEKFSMPPEVLAIFNAAETDCTVGGAKVGLMTGLLAVNALEGMTALALSIS
jgi:hypothetical protein